jgi:hypothetical protein
VSNLRTAATQSVSSPSLTSRYVARDTSGNVIGVFATQREAVRAFADSRPPNSRDSRNSANTPTA